MSPCPTAAAAAAAAARETEEDLEVVEEDEGLTWWQHPVIVRWFVRVDGPHQAAHTSSKHGSQESVQCRIEKDDEALEEYKCECYYHTQIVVSPLLKQLLQHSAEHQHSSMNSV